MSRLRASYLAISVTLLLALTAGSATASTSVRSGGATVSIASDTTTIGPATRGLKATVSIVTDKKGARIALSFAAPNYTRYIAKQPFREGSSLRLIGIEAITGPMRVIGSGGSSDGGGYCGDDFAPAHGQSTEDLSYDVQVPASSAVVLTVGYEIVGDAPWANTNYAPRVFVGPLESWNRRNRMTNRRKWDYFEKKTLLTAPRPFIAIPLAGRVDVDISPRPTRHFWGFGPIPADKPTKITGTLVPTRVGYPIELWIDQTRIKKSFLTDAKGQISYSFNPDPGYTVSVRATFPGIPGDELAPDSGCELLIDVDKKGKK